jgi:hypothetical protein
MYNQSIDHSSIRWLAMTSSTPPTPERLSLEKQQRLHALLERNSEAAITPEERTELEALVDASEKLMVSNGRRLVEFSQ